MDRRAFLRVVGGFSSGVAVSYAATQIPRLKDILPSSPYNKITLQQLFLPQEIVKFHHGGSHYMVKGVHSDNQFTGRMVYEAFDALMKVNPSNDASFFELKPEDDWVLIGAPSSSEVVSEILGYDPQTFERKPGKSPGLKYIYEYQKNVEVPLKRYMASGELQETAIDTKIRELETNNIWIPESSIDGWIEQDYLLVTRLPYRKKLGARTIVGGTHGTGTRAIDLLLQRALFTAKQKEILTGSASSGFQILVAVDSKTTGKRTEPIDLTVLDVVQL